MFFRFGSALVLAVIISLGATDLEKRNLELRRAVSRQHFRKEALLELYASQRLAAQQSGAPLRLIQRLDQDFAAAAPQPQSPAPPKPGR
jgi:hypothetical protein